MIISTAPLSTGNAQWLLADQLGTPRMVFDKTGAPANVKRHDYLPFGEELSSGQGVRSAALGYGAVDNIRQKFTSQERDNETGLDYMHARYFASAQGRFTSADTVAGSIGNPQSLNRYAYVGNNPMNLTDPTGHMPSIRTFSSIRDGGDSGGGSSWDDPTSPEAELRSYTALPAELEDERSRIAHASEQPSVGYVGDGIVQSGAGETPADEGISDSSGTVAVTSASLGVPQNSGQQSGTISGTVSEKPGPERLIFTTVSGSPHSANWNIQWKLAKPSKHGGWIVQEITETDISGNLVTHYWEAWRVRANDRFPTTHGPYAQDDTFQGGPSGNKVRAKARFYEGLHLPTSFGVGNVAEAGSLRSTTTNPHLPTNNATSVVVRTWTIP